jgi:hypothetical protein
MALPNTNITAGAPPLLWSDVHEAFRKINENFTSLDLATGGAAVNLEELFTSVSPSTDNEYSLGSNVKHWKAAYLGEYLDTPGDSINGAWLGTAQIKGVSGIIELPEGSTVNGNLIIDPNKTFFKSVQVDNGNQVVANSFIDTLNLNSGTSINLVVDSSAESITINNTGVTSIVAGTSISVSGATGAVTINNTGVTAVAAGTAVVGRPAGAGISVSNSTGNVTFTNTGLLGVQAGFGITVSTDTASGVSQISFNPTAAPQTGFTTIAIPGQTSLASDTTSDTLNFNAGYGIILTTTESTDTVTVTLNRNIDIKGSVFGDDSTILVDGVASRIPAEVVQGTFTGTVNGTASVATTVTLVATNTTAAEHFLTFVDTATGNENIRTDSGLTYNPGTNTLTAVNFAGSITGNIFTTLIDSSDSSAITVTPKTIFSSDVDVENELRVRGSLMISVAQLKTIAAASADFTAFKVAIAALTA